VLAVENRLGLAGSGKLVYFIGDRPGAKFRKTSRTGACCLLRLRGRRFVQKRSSGLAKFRPVRRRRFDGQLLAAESQFIQSISTAMIAGTRPKAWRPKHHCLLPPRARPASLLGGRALSLLVGNQPAYIFEEFAT